MYYLINKDETQRFPTNDDSFFIENGDNDEIALLHKAFQEFGGYADSYQSGALCLLDSTLSLNKSLRDYNVYPIIFLMRHYIELRLKELIIGINYCRDQTNVFPLHHNILELWKDFKIKYESIGENIDDSRFLVIEGLLKEVNSNDPNSMIFRYPMDKKGIRTQKLRNINLKNLRETFVRVCFVLDGIAAQIESYVDWTEDALSNLYGG
ncbi:hypothetical protein [Fulvivirga ligni]|uniref:hypothetical protein n=1 Tax=Fulvivirga ligni TaxID=2904246 RepID=UPI001F47E6CA|nr:hypothetical protein [Fulvivirga ligni]UII21669.1 hypothetical protein LVD16_00250 [Fulvivirga ligni]